MWRKMLSEYPLTVSAALLPLGNGQTIKFLPETKTFSVPIMREADAEIWVSLKHWYHMKSCPGFVYSTQRCNRKQILFFKCVNQRNKRPFVLTANEALVGTLMPIGDFNNIFSKIIGLLEGFIGYHQGAVASKWAWGPIIFISKFRFVHDINNQWAKFDKTLSAGSTSDECPFKHSPTAECTPSLSFWL